jgi:hypothetical protein
MLYPTLCVKINIINLRGFSFDSPPFLPIRFSQSQNNPVKQAISEIVPVQFIAKLIKVKLQILAFHFVIYAQKSSFSVAYGNMYPL